jgi:hypothetical protein
MDVRQHLTEIAHVEVGSADGAIAEVIGLGGGNYPQDRSRAAVPIIIRHLHQ